MDQAPIKIASIVKYALRYLVSLREESGLFSAWVNNDASRLALRDSGGDALLSDYIVYCATILDTYFGALRAHHVDEWEDPDSKITSTTVVNGMIIALRRSLPTLGVLGYGDYSALVENWQIDFRKEAFPYTSSQYAKFSQVVLRDMFNLVEVDGSWVRR